MRTFCRAFIWIFITGFSLSGCKVTKYVPQGKLLLKKNNIFINGETKGRGKLYPYMIQRPNAGVLPLKLYVYNLHKKDYLEKWEQRMQRYKDTTYWFPRVFSYKQALVYADFVRDLNKWAIDNGSPPSVVNPVKIKKTETNLKRHYFDQGYFGVKVRSEIDTIAPDKAEVNYYITTGKPKYIDSIRTHISSPVIDSLYRIHAEASLVKAGDQYDRMKLEQEADRLTEIFRNAGVYYFSRFAIGFFDIDTTQAVENTHLLLDISDRVVEEGDSTYYRKYKIFKISQVKVYTQYDFTNKAFTPHDSIRYNGIDYLAGDRQDYKPKYMDRYIFIHPGDVYSDQAVDLTRKRLRDLKNFKSIRISFDENDDEHLIARIYLSTQKKYAFKIETEATHENLKPFGISGKTSVLMRNLLGGGENLKWGMQGSFYSSLVNEENSVSGFNAWEWGENMQYKIPRFFPHFPYKMSANKKMSPLTTISLGFVTQKNIGLDKQRFTAKLQYDWNPRIDINHRLEVLNTQYIRNLNTGSFFDIYRSERRKLHEIYVHHYVGEMDFEPVVDFMNTALADPDLQQEDPEDYRRLLNIKKRYDIITEDVLVPSISYQFTYNTQRIYTQTQYQFFKMGISSSGLLATALTTSEDENTPKQIMGINIAQYVKTDVEYKRFWDVSAHNVLAFRVGLGVAIPYGNSDAIPFSRSYFAGGPNDIRAWNIYELGPGSEHSGLEFNVGNIKFITSLEYRFDIIAAFKGALFVDAGNIWDTRSSDIVSEEARFKWMDSLPEMAMGTGFGLRYNFGFLILRSDFGFKTYVPYEEPGRRWWNKNYMTPVLNLGINYPF